MPLAYIQLGTNLGNTFQNLQTAIEQLELHCGTIAKTSSIYKTAAWGNVEQDDFYNQVVLIKTFLAPTELLASLLAIEKNMGRVRTEKYAPRIIDLDILFYERQIINLEDLKIPHPHIAIRRFVLEPLVELVPKKIHPVLHISLSNLLENCADDLAVEKLK